MSIKMEPNITQDDSNTSIFKIKRKNMIIAGLIFMFGFYISASLIGDIFLHINGFAYSYQINTNKTLRILILCSVLSVSLTLFYTISFLTANIKSKNGIKIIKYVVCFYLILLSSYQLVFFNSNHQDEIDKGYKELLKVVNTKYQKESNKDQLIIQLQQDKIELKEDQLVNYIKHQKNLMMTIKKPS